MDPQDIDPEGMVRAQFSTERKKLRLRISHYYGNTVRKLFLAGGIAVLIFLPFQRDLLPFHSLALIFGALLFTLLAGLTSQKQHWAIIADMVAAALALVVFEYFAITRYADTGVDLVTLIRQALAINFFFALYFSCKTLRSWWDNPKPALPTEGIPH
jgi:lysylphosphatidylglycerol synthetase-like protein (DUF2156 family)